MQSLLLKNLEADIDNLPSKFPSDENFKFIKMPPEYLGKSGNFYNATSHHVMMIGECVAIRRDPVSQEIMFQDTNTKWWSRYVPHKPRK